MSKHNDRHHDFKLVLNHIDEMVEELGEINWDDSYSQQLVELTLLKTIKNGIRLLAKEKGWKGFEDSYSNE